MSGGCGLNCEWNRRWLETYLFSDVFIPLCTNDTGSAIGTAVDAMRHFTGNAKIK
ncbi:carbamoyltransferase N-terminal domain-containing protein [Mesorhizobium sp. YC-2]|uniref:carbamoyltransferase N-terminal domain-containing protein n=1 Tax=Mesorhizobium sp. YC-2 TaxID=2986064 RepID=UPI0039945499